MLLFFASLMLISSLTEARADVISDYYYIAKEYIRPGLLQKAEYLASSQGSPYIFPEKPVTPKALLGIAASGASDPLTYNDGELPDWVFSATQLGIHVTHWAKLAQEQNVPQNIWQPKLDRYEDYQLTKIKEHQRTDGLSNIDSKALFREEYGNYDGILYRGNYSNRSSTARDQHVLVQKFARNHELSTGEILLLDFYQSLYDYVVKEKQSPDAFWMWQPTCECGNGFFSIAVEIEPARSNVILISEFAFRVCQEMVQQKIKSLAACVGAHYVATGQKIYLSGDYRYQHDLPENSSTTIRSIRLRDKEQAVSSSSGIRLLKFREDGHVIVE